MIGRRVRFDANEVLNSAAFHRRSTLVGILGRGGNYVEE
jgi:hypothetical protein